MSDLKDKPNAAWSGGINWPTYEVHDTRNPNHPAHCVESGPLEPGMMRKFEGGATRNVDAGKLDYEGFLSPVVLERYARYLHRHRVQADGKLRDSDNWQKGIPKDVYMKSLLRHLIEVWTYHREPVSDIPDVKECDDVYKEDALCAVMFNTMGYLFECLREETK